MLLCSELNQIEQKDWMLLILGGAISFVVSIAWTFFLFFTKCFKPNLKIYLDSINNAEIKIRVENKNSRAAVNLRIETCFINKGGTFHLNLDKDDFLILPGKDYRIFKTDKLSESAKGYIVNNKEMTYAELLSQYHNKECTIRVRVHATDEYSSLGKAFESKF